MLTGPAPEPAAEFWCECEQVYPSQSAMLACLLEHDLEDASVRRAGRHVHRRPAPRFPNWPDGWGSDD